MTPHELGNILNCSGVNINLNVSRLRCSSGLQSKKKKKLFECLGEKM